jgi:hypothetical protein
MSRCHLQCCLGYSHPCHPSNLAKLMLSPDANHSRLPHVRSLRHHPRYSRRRDYCLRLSPQCRRFLLSCLAAHAVPVAARHRIPLQKHSGTVWGGENERLYLPRSAHALQPFLRRSSLHLGSLRRDREPTADRVCFAAPKSRVAGRV